LCSSPLVWRVKERKRRREAAGTGKGGEGGERGFFSPFTSPTLLWKVRERIKEDGPGAMAHKEEKKGRGEEEKSQPRLTLFGCYLQLRTLVPMQRHRKR